MFDLKKYTTLFLDRDGVINIERKNDYVKNRDEFIFIDNSLDAISILTEKFRRIFIVTNQRGIGRNIMTYDDLIDIHKYMLKKIKEHGGNISHIYTCTDINPTTINRKPNIGMAFQAKEDYPDIVFTNSVMVGNSRSDIEFGNKLGMYTILVGDKYPKEDKIYNKTCAYFPNLYEFALSL